MKPDDKHEALTFHELTQTEVGAMGDEAQYAKFLEDQLTNQEVVVKGPSRSLHERKMMGRL